MANRRRSDGSSSTRGNPSVETIDGDIAENPDEVLERVSEAFFALDEEWRFTYLNSRAEEVLETSAEELVGEKVWEQFSAAVDLEFYDQAQGAMETQQSVSFEEYYPPLDTWFEVSIYPSESGLSVYFRDVTRRHRREQQLHARVEQQQRAAEFGRRALTREDLDDLFEEAVAVLSETLETPYASVLERIDSGTLRQRAAVGWDGDGRSIDPSSATHAFETLTEGTPVVVPDFEADERFERTAAFQQRGIRSSISVVIGTPEDPWGLIAVYGTDPREFTDHDAAFVRSIANTLMSAIERKIHERALLQQGRQLAALNQLNTVAREINHAIAQQTSREEIEQLFCDRLTSSSSYQLAWIGEVDEDAQEVTVRTARGVTDYLEEVSISLDDREGQFGPAAMAVRTGETQVIRDLSASPQFEPWRGVAEKYDLESLAVVPIQYEGSLYGTFALYADREDAFTGEELAVIEDLGEIVGHTIQSLERKRLLMTDDVVQIDLRLQRIDEVYDVFEMEAEDRIAFEQIVALGESDFLAYGTSTIPPDDLSEMVTAVPHFDDVDVNERDDDAWRFTLHLVDPPALSTIAAHGGRINSATIEGGDYRMQIELPADVEARSVLDPIRESYPSLETLAQRRVTSDHRLSTTTPSLESMLTDRQRAVLEAAYYGGYFEWPRDVSAEDLAEQMDVSPPTLHEHLRNAQRKAFVKLLDGGPDE